MKMKKFIALLVAATMTLLPMSTAFADQSDLTGVSNTSDATINYIDASQVIKITVPTSVSMGFTLDPQNLAATQGVGTWNPASGGAILPQAVVTVVNKSAVPVKTSIDFEVNDTASTKSTLVNSATGINDGTAKKMFLTLTPANQKTSVSSAAIGVTTVPSFYQQGAVDVTFTAQALIDANVPASKIITSAASGGAIFGDFVCTDDSATNKTYKQVVVPVISVTHAAITATTVNDFTSGYASTANQVPVISGGASMIYLMDNADYYVSKKVDESFELVYRDGDTNTNYDTASFLIGGEINKNADWSGYDGAVNKISLTAEYTFETLTEAEASGVTILSGTHNSVGNSVPNTPASVVTSTATFSKATGGTITVNLGSGTGATTVSSLATVTTGEYPWDPSTYTVSGTTITMKTNALIASVQSGQTRNIKVTFASGVTGTVTVTIQN